MMHNVSFLKGSVSFNTSLSLEKLADLVALKFLSGGHFGGREASLTEEVPSVYILGFFGGNFIVAGSAGMYYVDIWPHYDFPFIFFKDIENVPEIDLSPTLEYVATGMDEVTVLKESSNVGPQKIIGYVELVSEMPIEDVTLAVASKIAGNAPLHRVDNSNGVDPIYSIDPFLGGRLVFDRKPDSSVYRLRLEPITDYVGIEQQPEVDLSALMHYCLTLATGLHVTGSGTGSGFVPADEDE